MFYLGKEDLANERELIGKGIRGMFGVKTKKEAVEDVLKNTDLSSAEGRQNALNQIRQIDPEQYKFWRNENQKYEQTLTQGKQAQIDLERASMQREDLVNKRLAAKNRPKLDKQFELGAGKGDTINAWLRNNYATQIEESGIADEEIKKVRDYPQLSRILRKLGVESGKVNSRVNEAKAQVKLTKEYFIQDNLYNPDLKMTKFEVRSDMFGEDSAANKDAIPSPYNVPNTISRGIGPKDITEADNIKTQIKNIQDSYNQQIINNPQAASQLRLERDAKLKPFQDKLFGLQGYGPAQEQYQEALVPKDEYLNFAP